MAGPQEGWLRREGIDLHYLEWSPRDDADPTPILLLHGLGSNAHYWSRLAAHLHDRRLVALDQRGHGLTARPPHAPQVPDGFAMNELLADAGFAAERLGLDRPVVVGHSWGATISLELVARNPGLASSLVFIDGPIQSAANLFSWDEAQSIMQPPLPRYASLVEAIADVKNDFGASWGEDLEPFVLARVMQDGDHMVLTLSAEARLELLRGLYDSLVELLWTELDVPAVALLARDASTRVASWKDRGAANLQRIAPRVDVKWFDTPHDIPLFAPAGVADAIGGLAKRPAEPAGSEAAAGQQL